jgi:hypothetical protein
MPLRQSSGALAVQTGLLRVTGRTPYHELGRFLAISLVVISQRER